VKILYSRLRYSHGWSLHQALDLDDGLDGDKVKK